MDPLDNENQGGGVDPSLLDAVTLIESNNNPNAVSPVGAKGLMQLMDATGQGQMAKLGLEGEYDPFNPDLNRRLGEAELGDQIKNSSGDERLALAKYNYGSGNVAKLQAKYGETYDDIAAHLPAETRNYVPKVLAARAKMQGEQGEQGEEIAPQNADYSKYSNNAQGFAEALLPIISNPSFDTLPLAEKAAEVSKVFGAKKWGADAYDVVKQVMTNYTDAAPDEERPNLAEVISPPPRIQPGEDAKTILSTWKNNELMKLHKAGISPSIFGNALDQYLDEAGSSEEKANEFRNRGILGEIASGTYALGLNVVKGVGYGITKPIAGITRLAGSYVNPEGANELSNSIENLPELLGKPVQDYIYDTDENGYLVKNEDGTYRTKWQTDAEMMVGQIGSFIGGGFALKAAGASARVLQGSLLAANTLTMANDSFRTVYEETGGDVTKSYKASMYSIPAGVVGAIGDYAVVAKWANPAIKALGAFNKATYLANVFARNAAVGAGSNVGADVISQYGETEQTGSPYNLKRTAAAAIGGGVAGGALGAYAARKNTPAIAPQNTPNDVPAPAPAPEQLALEGPKELLGLPAPEERNLLQYPVGQKQIGTNLQGPDTPIQVYAPTTKEVQDQVLQGLENFQKSRASTLILSAEQAKNIPPEMFSVFQITPAADGHTTLLTKIETYLQRESGTIEGATVLIDNLKTDLANSPSPESIQTLHEERVALKKQIKVEGADLNREMVALVKERQQYQQAYDKAKDLAENQTDPILKKVARIEQRQAEQDLQAFDEINADAYEAHQKIQPLQDRLDVLNTRLKSTTANTYANDLKAKERNLESLIKKRQELTLIREKEIGSANKEARTIEQEKFIAARRGEALAKIGIEGEPTLDFSNGVQVEGHTIIPIQDRWYVIDKYGEIQGKPHDYYYDAVESVTRPPEVTDRSFVIYPKDKTALTKADELAIREQIKARAAEELRVQGVKADVSEKAKAYRAKVYEAEVKAAIKKAKADIAARRKKGVKVERTPSVTALGDEVRGLSDGETAVVGEGTPEADTSKPEDIKGLGLSKSRSLTRRHISGAHKPLSSNFTPLKKFAQTKKEVVTPKSIFKKGEKLLNSISKGLKVFHGGKVPKNTLGFLSPLRDYITIGRDNDVMTFLHEAMHGVDRALIGKWHNDNATPNWSDIPSKVLEAAKDQADTFYPSPLKGDDLRIQEGLAMFYQHYATGQPYRKEIGNWYHGDFAKKNPDAYKALEQIKDATHAYYEQTPEAAVLSTVVEKPNTDLAKAKKYFTWKNLKDKWVDRNSIFSDVDKATGSKARVKDWADANHKRGVALAESLLSTGKVFNGKTYETFSLQEAFAPAEGKLKDLEAYMIAKREQARYHTADLESGTNLEDVQLTVDNASPGIKSAANNYYKILDTLYNIVGDSSKEGAYYIQKLREANREITGASHGYYVPFAREGKVSFNPTAKVTGSTRSKVDPIGNIQDAFETMLTKAMQSQVKQQLVSLATGPHASSIGQYIHEVTGYKKIGLAEKYARDVQGDSKTAPTHNDKTLHAFFSDAMEGVSSSEFKVMPYMDGNKLRFFEVDPRIINAFTDGLPEFVNSAWFKYIIRPGAQIFRPAATSLRAAFQIKNSIRDPIAAWKIINSGEDTPGLSGAKDALLLAKNIASNFIDSAQGGKMSQWVEESGLRYSNRSGAVEEIRAQVQKQFGSNFLDFGAKSLNAFERFISIPERATRAAAMQVEAKRLGITDFNAPMTPDQQLDLMLMYKRSTTNFGIQGSSGRVVNFGIPFFTARINELTRQAGDFKRNPSRYAAYGLSMFTYGIYHALAHADQEWYQEMQPDAKMNSAWFRMNVDGVEKAVMIPLDSGGALAWGLGQAIGNKMSNDPALPLEYKDLARAYFSMNVSPINSVLDIATPWGKEAIQQFANKDQFTGRNIVPPSLQYQSPAQQYTEMTSEVSKSVGNLTGISPIRLDHIIRSAAPAAADALHFMDRALGYKTQKDVQSSNFVINALSRAGTTSNIADRAQLLFADKLAEARANKFEETAEEGQVRKVLERMNKDMGNINIVLSAGEMTQEERDTLRKTRVKILKEGIAIANSGAIEAPITSSGTKSEAESIRKRRSEELRNVSEKRKKAVSSSALQGSTD